MKVGDAIGNWPLQKNETDSRLADPFPVAFSRYNLIAVRGNGLSSDIVSRNVENTGSRSYQQGHLPATVEGVVVEG